jgi:hypothetical protein
MPQTQARAAELFWSKVDKTDTCWLWNAAMGRGGYGSFHGLGRTQSAHRFAYRLQFGPIPAGLQVDHRCHNEDPTCEGGEDCLHRRCVNPAHLEAVTGRQNTLRGNTPAGRNARKTHCDHGHEFTPENTHHVRPSRSQPNGGRRCRICRRAAQARFRLRRRSVADVLADSATTPA